MKKYCVVDSVDLYVYVTSLDSWSPNLKGTIIVHYYASRKTRKRNCYDYVDSDLTIAGAPRLPLYHRECLQNVLSGFKDIAQGMEGA